MIPTWQPSALDGIPHRHSATLSYKDETIVLEFIGSTTIAIMRSHHKKNDLRHGDVVWIKEMMEDGITIKSLQLFSEGLPGAARGLDRVHQVEEAKERGLTQVARELIKLLSVIENAKKGDDDTLVNFLSPHLLFMELFHATNPNDLEQMRKEDVNRIRAMLKACCTIEDKWGRRNPGCKDTTTKGARRRIIHMSKRRMAMANKAGMVSATLTILMNAFHALVTEVHTEITNKLNAKSWNYKKPKHMQWLKNFGNKLEIWTGEMGSVNMHPFAHRGAEAQLHLMNAASIIWRLTSPETQQITDNDIKSVMINSIKNELELVLKETRILLARFQLAELLRVVGTAKDPRVRALDIAITQPNWRRINSELQAVCGIFGIERAPLRIPPPLKTEGDEALTAYYSELRAVARMHDEGVRSAA